MYCLIQGDNRDVLKAFPEDHFDSVVCDPPYGLSFMGKDWDHGVPGEHYWREILRVAKPGAHLLAFGGTKTHHRLMVAIEDAGWEIRDCLMWTYSQGFPKSHNIDRLKGVISCGCEETKSASKYDMRSMREADISPAISDDATKEETLQHVLPQYGVSMQEQTYRSGEHEGSKQSSMERRSNNIPQEGELREYPIFEGARLGDSNGSQGRICDGASSDNGPVVRLSVDTRGSGTPSKPQSERHNGCELGTMAEQSQPQTRGAWPLCDRCGKSILPSGMGTALKPAWEPIIMARKPLIGTVAENVLRYGTGAINIDACRVETIDNLNGGAYSDGRKPSASEWVKHGGTIHSFTGKEYTQPPGRWPANLIHDGSQEVLALFPESKTSRIEKPSDCAVEGATSFQSMRGNRPARGYDGEGSAARFFYCAKASSADRHEGLRDAPGKRFKHGDLPRQFEDANASPAGNCHPTVKPTALMRYLCRLVTPMGGTILDSFCGSGSTGKGAVAEGFSFIGIDLSPIDVAAQRVIHAGYKEVSSASL